MDPPPPPIGSARSSKGFAMLGRISARVRIAPPLASPALCAGPPRVLTTVSPSCSLFSSQASRLALQGAQRAEKV
jgi:hypothetical protein